MEFNENDFLLHTYKSQLDLFHQRRKDYNEATSYSRKSVMIAAKKCIAKGLLTLDDYKTDLLPIVDFAELLGYKGNIAGDGEE
jgi:hypothetical protein